MALLLGVRQRHIHHTTYGLDNGMKGLTILTDDWPGYCALPGAYASVGGAE